MGWATSRVADGSSDERRGEPEAGPGTLVAGVAAPEALREKRSGAGANREPFAGYSIPRNISSGEEG
jgi:hypothetical protein